MTCETTPFLIKPSTSSCTKDIFSLADLLFFKIILAGLAPSGNIYPSFKTYNIYKFSVISFNLSRRFPNLPTGESRLSSMPESSSVILTFTLILLRFVFTLDYLF